MTKKPKIGNLHNPYQNQLLIFYKGFVRNAVEFME